MTNTDELFDRLARAVVEHDEDAPPSWAAEARSIALAEAHGDPWNRLHLSRPAPQALVEAVKAARSDERIRGEIWAKRSRLRDQVRNAKMRIDTENELNGTSLAYPAWVSNYLKDNAID